MLNALSWYDENAAKVIRKVEKFDRGQLARCCSGWAAARPSCPTSATTPTASPANSSPSSPAATCAIARASPLADSIHRFFKAEVQPHVEEAWINLESVKIGYEISFNKYFYKHQPLRSMEEVAREIVALERQAEGLIAAVLGIDVAAMQGF